MALISSLNSTSGGIFALPVYCSDFGARDNKKTRISPRHLQLAVRNDEELNRLLGGVTIAQFGVLPNIQSVLPPKKAEKKSKA